MRDNFPCPLFFYVIDDHPLRTLNVRPHLGPMIGLPRLRQLVNTLSEAIEARDIEATFAGQDWLAHLCDELNHGTSCRHRRPPLVIVQNVR